MRRGRRGRDRGGRRIRGGVVRGGVRVRVITGGRERGVGVRIRGRVQGNGHLLPLHRYSQPLCILSILPVHLRVLGGRGGVRGGFKHAAFAVALAILLYFAVPENAILQRTHLQKDRFQSLKINLPTLCDISKQ